MTINKVPTNQSVVVRGWMSLFTTTVLVAVMASCSTLQAVPAPPGLRSASAQNVKFPKELHGFWVSSVQKCSDDTEAMMDVTSNQLVGYEEVLKPTKVTKLSGSPMTWKIEMDVDVGPSGIFTEYGPIEFTIVDEILTSNYKSFTDTYRKCDGERP